MPAYASITFQSDNSEAIKRLALNLRHDLCKDMDMATVFKIARGQDPLEVNSEYRILDAEDAAKRAGVTCILRLSKEAERERNEAALARLEAERRLAEWEEAVAWVRSLPAKEKKYIDILVASSHPRA